METARQLILDSLYLLIKQLMVSDKRARPSNALNQSTAIEDERQILSIAQDIIHCNSKGRVKLPKHTSLAMCVHHLTSSKRLIKLLNRMGHCISYDEMYAVNTSIAEDVLAKAEEFGTVIPTVIKASTVDELRYFMFCQKKQKNDMLPPTSDCLLQHLKRSNYQAFVWRHALEAMQDLESPEGHGWVRDEKHLLPLLMTKAPAPESLLELTT